MSSSLSAVKETLTLRSRMIFKARIGKKQGCMTRTLDCSTWDMGSTLLFNNISNILKSTDFNRRRLPIALHIKKLIQSQLTSQRSQRSHSKWPRQEERSSLRMLIRLTLSIFYFTQTMFKGMWTECKGSTTRRWLESTASWLCNRKPTLVGQGKLDRGSIGTLLSIRDQRCTKREIVLAKRLNTRRMLTS